MCTGGGFLLGDSPTAGSRGGSEVRGGGPFGIDFVVGGRAGGISIPGTSGGAFAGSAIPGCGSVRGCLLGGGLDEIGAGCANVGFFSVAREGDVWIGGSGFVAGAGC